MMTNRINTLSKFLKLMRYSARGLVILWALWWIFFGITSIAMEEANNRDIFAGIVIIIIFTFSAVCPWFWEKLGSIILLIEGTIILIGYPFVARSLPIINIFSMEISLALPPLITGALFFLSSKMRKHKFSIEG